MTWASCWRRSVGLLLGSALLAGWIFAEGPADRDVEATVVKVRQALEKKDYAAARKLAAAFLDDPNQAVHPLRERVRYYHGVACFFLGDHIAAGRSLNQLTPFDQPDLGSAARYLLARVHHLAGERNEAALHYEAVLADKTAGAADHVNRAGFCLGVLRFEDGRFAEAYELFDDVTGLLADEARLCRGMCEVQLGKFAEAVHTLEPLTEKQPQAAAALLWLGKAQAGLARGDDADRPMFAQAVTTLKRAVEASSQSARGDVLLQLAATLQLAGQTREAAAILQKIFDDRLLPNREEELLLKRAAALSLAGRFADSEQMCEQFLKKYPRSPFLAEVHFRRAENAAFLGHHAEAIRRYQHVIDRFPEFEQVHHARHALALVHYRGGAFDQARAVWETIPVTEHRDDLARVPFYLGDCLLRLAPKTADDALAAGQLRDQLTRAVELLGDFVQSQPEDPHAPDALLRLGFCHRRLADLYASPEEQDQHREASRTSFESVLLDYPLCDQQPHAALERAKILGRAGDHEGAVTRLRRFVAGPLQNHPLAPLAVLQTAAWLRAQGKVGDAEHVLARGRQQHEKALLDDRTRAGWVPLLWYHHAITLSEASRPADGRRLLEKLRARYPDRPESAEAILRWGQCRWNEGWQKIHQAKDALQAEHLQPDEAARLRRAVAEGQQMARQAVRHCEDEAHRLKKEKPGSDLAARLLYRAGWMYRTFAAIEVSAVRDQLQEKLGRDVPLAEIELQPMEKKVRELYRALIADFPDHPLAIAARLELAEAHADRGDFAAAITLLNEAIDKEPHADMTDRIRLRLGMCHLGCGNLAAALRQFDVVGARRESALAPQALLRAAECRMLQKDWAGAVQHFAVFRDEEAFQGHGGVSDRALLRLGHALQRLRRWDDCRKACDLLVERFGDSTWASGARYAAGWSYLQQKDPERAAALFQQAVGDEPGLVSGRAQLMLGVCRLEQKQLKEALAALQAVLMKANEPEVRALALVEAGHVAAKLGQREQAEKLWQQVLDDLAETSWAATAMERLKMKAGDAPAPHTLAAAERLLTPDLPEPLPPLEQLGEQQPDWVPADDPSDDLALAAVLARVPAARPTPFAPLPAAPDPFALRELMRDRIWTEEPLQLPRP